MNSIIEGLKILPRYVRLTDNGLRLFQRELIDAILDCNRKIIITEAPVGSGKTFAIKYLLINNLVERKPLILLYPTKILMEAQVSSLKRDVGGKKLNIWPYDEFECDTINLALYSSDSLVTYMKNNRMDILNEQRSDLLYRLFMNIELFSSRGAIVTSPDVFYLLIKGKYKNSNKILNIVKNSIVIFDEFHCYYGLDNFQFLIEELCDKTADKIVLLSATPLIKEEIKEIGKRYGDIRYISFENSQGDEKDICFNYELKGKIYSFKISDIKQTFEILKEVLSEIELPAAIVFDSIFRLRHIKREIERMIKDNKILIQEWSGMKKEEDLKLNQQTLILGTSSIEVGIDMRFKTLIFEASYWPSGIQRLGRVGRNEEGSFIILTRKDFYPYLKDKKVFTRNEFENILKNVLKEPKEEISDEYFFRGRSFKFLLYDMDLKETFLYNENIFAMYDIEEFVDNWQYLTNEEKFKELKNLGIPEERINEFLIHDKIFPIWGLLKGRIKDEYDFLTPSNIKFLESRKELHIETSKGRYVFYGEDVDSLN